MTLYQRIKPDSLAWELFNCAEWEIREISQRLGVDAKKAKVRLGMLLASHTLEELQRNPLYRVHTISITESETRYCLWINSYEYWLTFQWKSSIHAWDIDLERIPEGGFSKPWN